MYFSQAAPIPYLHVASGLASCVQHRRQAVVTPNAGVSPASKLSSSTLSGVQGAQQMAAIGSCGPARFRRRWAGASARQKRPGEDKEKAEARQAYVVKLVTPPARNLGLHCLPQNTQCGESIDIEGEEFIVSGVTYTYRLWKGKYEAKQKRLDVQSQGRYLVNLYLTDLLQRS